MGLEDIAVKYRDKPIRVAHVVVEAETIRLFITYMDNTESSIKFKTREAAEKVRELLHVKPLPCRVCGGQPAATDKMISCNRCSIHVSGRSKWDDLMRESPNVRQLVADLSEPLAICKSILVDNADEFLAHQIVNMLVRLQKLDLSAFYVRAQDARSAEEGFKKSVLRKP